MYVALTLITYAFFQALTLDSLEPKTFLTPFLDVIRSEAVTGSVTGLALDSVHKFLSYQVCLRSLFANTCLHHQ